MLHLFDLGVIFLIVRLKVEETEQLVYKIFSKVTFEEYVRYLAEEIVDSKVDGHSDHGLLLIPYYVKLAKGEEVDIGGQGVPPISPKGKVEIGKLRDPLI